MTKKSKTTPFPRPKKLRTEPFWKELNQIIDPELGIGVVDLGLIYDIVLNDKKEATIKMSLTSPACPVGPMLVMQIEDCMRTQKGISDAHAEIVWDPPWSQEMIDPELREMMFGY